MTSDQPGPRLEFERLLGQLVEQAEGMGDAQARVRELIRINQDLTSRRDLPSLLGRVVEIARQLVGAGQAVVAVLGPDGSPERIVPAGLDEAEANTLVREPVGRRTQPPTIGVLLRVEGSVYGTLHLAGPTDGAFTADDEEVARALASAASVAIENALLYSEARYRERVSQRLVELSRSALRSDDADDVTDVVDAVADLVESDLVVAGALGGRGQLVVEHAHGHGADSMLALSFPVEGTFVGRAFDADGPLVIPDVSGHPTYGFDEQADFGEVLFVPFVLGDSPAGLLVLCRLLGRPSFTERDIATAEAFALQLGVVHERAESRESRRRITLMEDRERIAQDLHDHVIQRLFATGMNLQVAAGKADERLRELLDRQIGEIDDAIVQIRQSIFAIRGAGREAAPSLRARILEIIERVEDHPSVRPTVTFVGPVDLLVDGSLTDDVVAVSTEAVSNALQHARAERVDLTVAAADGRVTVEVQDDGTGISEQTDGHGLSNLRRRAEERGGALEVGGCGPRGTRLLWSVPTP